MGLLHLEEFESILKDEARVHCRRNYVFTGLTKDRIETTKNMIVNSDDRRKYILDIPILFGDTDIANLNNIISETTTFPSDKQNDISTIMCKYYVLGLIAGRLKLSNTLLFNEINGRLDMSGLKRLRDAKDFIEYRERLTKLRNATNIDETLYKIVRQMELNHRVMLHFFLDNIQMNPKLQAEINSHFNFHIKPFMSRIYSQNPLLHYDSSNGNRLDQGVDFTLYTGIYEDEPNQLIKKE